MRNYLVRGTLILDGRFIVTYEAGIPLALSGFMPMAVARVGGRVGRERGEP